MKPYFVLKRWLKMIRWPLRRARVARRWGVENLQNAPIVFANAMPKSGSHLLQQIVKGFVRIGPFVDTGFPSVNRSEDNVNLPVELVAANLERIRPGDIGHGKLNAIEPYLSIVTRPGWVTVFLYRDPRDLVVSHVFYASQMNPRHGMYAYYNTETHSMEERISTAIQGVELPGGGMPSVFVRFERVMDWLEQPEVLCLRFEDLILEREVALNQLLDHLARQGFSPEMSRHQAVAALAGSIAPRKSGTFRKGQPGNWSEYFTEANKTLMKEVAGDLLVRLGYEKDRDW